MCVRRVRRLDRRTLGRKNLLHPEALPHKRLVPRHVDRASRGVGDRRWIALGRSDGRRDRPIGTRGRAVGVHPDVEVAAPEKTATGVVWSDSTVAAMFPAPTVVLSSDPLTRFQVDPSALVSVKISPLA